MRQSIWERDVEFPSFPKLEGDIKTDVLVIGGGLCGVLCAWFLKQAGVDYVLVEGDAVGRGVTCNTTAKITSQHGLIYEKLLRTQGKEKALQYLDANQWALGKYRELAEETECDFEEKDAFVYTLTDWQKIEREVQALETLGFPAEFVQEVNLPFDTEGAVKFPRQAQFQPRRFLAYISRDLNIYEHTFIQELAPGCARYDGGTITARRMIAATHFPFLNKHGAYFLKLYQHRSYVIALEKAQDVHGMYMDSEKTGMSFRNYRDLLLIGGGSHRTGKKGGNWQELRKFSGAVYPSAREVGAWAAQDCMSLDQISYIGWYSKRTSDLYVISGCNKWGMTTSMAGAMMLCDMLMGKENIYEDVFFPSRNMLKPQLLLNGAEAVKNLLTPTTRRCPHLGCALKWNALEHTWDCPCHGSRFEENGKIIDNPATGNMKMIHK